MVIVHAHPEGAELRGEFFASTAAAAVDDTRARNRIAYAGDLADFILGFPHDVREIRAFEARFKHERFAEAQLVHNVRAHRGRGCGREGDDGSVDQLTKRADLEVVRTEIVAPLRDAVRFVHHYQ